MKKLTSYRIAALQAIRNGTNPRDAISSAGLRSMRRAGLVGHRNHGWYLTEAGRKALAEAEANAA